MLNVNAEGVPLVGIKSALSRNLGHDIWRKLTKHVTSVRTLIYAP